LKLNELLEDLLARLNEFVNDHYHIAKDPNGVASTPTPLARGNESPGGRFHGRV